MPVADAVANAYDISKTTVNSLSFVYMGLNILMNFPAAFIIGKYGLRSGVK